MTNEESGTLTVQASPLAPTSAGKSLPGWAWLLAALLAGLLVFWNLGHYGLWDDEADTALFGQSVWRTGDLDFRVGKNIVAIYDGSLIVNSKQRYMPPLQYYVVAPFVGNFPTSALAARLPFAALGYGLVLFMLFAARRHCPDRSSALLAIAVILTLVPLYLFARQCRYYAITMVATAGVLYLYYTFDSRRRTLAATAAFLWAVLASQYLAFAGLVAALGLDYLLCRRRSAAPRYTVKQIAAVAVPVILLGAPVVLWCNPYGRLGAESTAALVSLKLRWMAIRLYFLEANNNNIYCLLALGIGMVLAWLRRDLLLARVVLAIVAYTVTVALLAKGTANDICIADRYLVGLLPLTVLLYARVLWQTWQFRPLPAVVLAIALLLTNVLSLEWTESSLRSHIAEYVMELAHPPKANTTSLAEFVKAHIPPGSTIDANMTHHLYPLMFHAPEYLYTAQLPPESRAKFPGLGDEHFRGEFAADYAIRAGPYNWDLSEGLHLNSGAVCGYDRFGIVASHAVSSFRPRHADRLYFRSPLIQCYGMSDFIHIYSRSDLHVQPVPLPPEVLPYVEAERQPRRR